MLRRNDGKIVVIIVAVVLVLACAVGGLAVLKAKKPHGKAKIPDGPVTMMPIGEMIVNLADSAEIRYLKIDAILEVRGKLEASGGEGEGGDSTLKAPLRDAMITVLSSKRMADLNKPDGKETLKAEITEACNKRLEEAKVTNVYFNEFAMQ